MSLRQTLPFIFLCTLFSCLDKRKQDVYNVDNYKLYRIDSSDNIIGAKYYHFKFSNDRNFAIYYWDNGSVLAKGFLYKGLKDGYLYQYYSNGKVSSIEKFKEGLKIDTTFIFDTNGLLKTSKVFYRDTLIKTLNF